MAHDETEAAAAADTAARAGLMLIQLSLAMYLTPGEARAKLVAWMESQQREFESQGLPPEVLRYFSGFVEGLRMGQPAEMLKAAHRPADGLH